MARPKRVGDIPLYIGEYLQHELKRRGITQMDFAEMIGVKDDRTVRRWISGGIDSVMRVFEIADCLGVSVRDILPDDGDDSPLPFYYIKAFFGALFLFFPKFAKADISCPRKHQKTVVEYDQAKPKYTNITKEGDTNVGIFGNHVISFSIKCIMGGLICIQSSVKAITEKNALTAE